MRSIISDHFMWFATLAIVLLVVTLTVAGIVYNKDGTLNVEKSFDRELYRQYLKDGFHRLNDMLLDFDVHQAEWLPLVPPGMPLLVQSAGLRCFDPKHFPERLAEQLIGVKYEGGVTVYPVTILEDPETRERVVYNVEFKEIGRFNSPEDYDWRWLMLERCPNLYDGAYMVEQIAYFEYMYDPSRIGVSYDLILKDDLLAYVLYISLKPEPPIVIMKAYEGPPLTNIKITAMEKIGSVGVGHPVRLTIAYPYNGATYPTNCFTNRIDIFVSTNLLTDIWTLEVTTNVSASTNWIEWTDPVSSNLDCRFYAVASADCNSDTDADGDGLTWGRENYLYNTFPTNVDTDSDGLVDGYSGVVPTNDYPSGISTDGVYVEGELSRGTDPLVYDSDGDGVGDGYEVATGTDPTDPNDPPSISGTVSYSGRQTGTVYVVAVTGSDSWATNKCDTMTGQGLYQVALLSQTNYWIKAFRDTDGNASNGTTEAWGAYTNNPVTVTNHVTGISIVITDPDDDSDGLPDWWEVQYWGDTTSQNASGDPDSDTYNNLQEYTAETDPTNGASLPLTISGTVSYSGGTTGTIYIEACTSLVGWASLASTNILTPGSYTIDCVSPNKSYWIKAYRDYDGDQTADSDEAWGIYSTNSIYLTNSAAGINIMLDDPDMDADDIPDWWENQYGYSTNSGMDMFYVAGFWKFDADSGTNVLDSSVYTNHGHTVNISSGWTGGVVGNALSFDGQNDYVQLYNNYWLNPQYLTISLWVKPSMDYSNSAAVFFTKRLSGAANGYQLSYADGYLSFIAGATQIKEVKHACVLKAGTWYHIAGTYAGALQRLYTNGILVAEGEWDWGMNMGDIQPSATDPRMGASVDAVPTNFFAGIMDEALITTTIWTSNQVWGAYEIGADFDGDGLSTWGEYQADTCPTNSDTDGDGYNDYEELITYRTDPNNDDTTPPTITISTPENGWQIEVAL
ncbi:MAG: LamG domain-containing protein [Lentisphaerae bacterium]|nr:LamG domain-containing protein [Lentisphaerota bacterium]